MYNWSTDEKELKKHPQKYQIWRLEQLINYGLGKEKLNKKEVESMLPRLKIDPQKKKYIKFLLG